LCTGAEQKLAGVWDDARRKAVQTAFGATKRPYAQAAFDGIAKRFDDRSRAWVAMHTEACEATRVRGEQLASVMSLRMTCSIEDCAS